MLSLPRHEQHTHRGTLWRWKTQVFLLCEYIPIHAFSSPILSQFEWLMKSNTWDHKFGCTCVCCTTLMYTPSFLYSFPAGYYGEKDTNRGVQTRGKENGCLGMMTEEFSSCKTKYYTENCPAYSCLPPCHMCKSKLIIRLLLQQSHHHDDTLLQ